jgi:histidine triad (HIT) family protein
MQECIFCKIASGEIPVVPVYETVDVIAFDDINPQAPVHTLVIPKAHVVSLADPALTPEIVSAVMLAVNEVARAKGVEASGYRTILNTGPDSGQEVFHLHVHVLGGKRMPPDMVCTDE